MALTKITRTVVDSISSFFNINSTTGALTSTVPDLAPANSTLYPAFSCRAWVNFHGIQSGTLTYTISGNLVTVTQSSHGMTTGMIANLTFSSGTVSGTADYVITRVNDNSYTVTVAVSGSTGGNVVRNTFIRACGNVSGVTRNSTGNYTVNFTTAMPDTNYNIVIGYSSDYNDFVPSASTRIVLIYGTPTTGNFTIISGAQAGGGGSFIDFPILNVAVFR